MKRIYGCILALALLAGCAGRDGGTPEPPPPMDFTAEADLMEGVQAREEEPAEITGGQATVLADLGWRLFNACLTEENTLVSPLSVLEALGMTANGAGGETLEQMETVLGMPSEELNVCLGAYVRTLPDSAGGRLRAANGLWLNADMGLSVRPEFLQANADWYGAEARSLPFDGDAPEQINDWVDKKTKGRVEKIVEELGPDAALVLVNALTFDGLWEEPYREDQIRDGEFTTAAGEKRDVEMMRSTGQVYLRDDDAVGFVRYYQDRGYAFAALLPNRGTTLQDYAATLTGERWRTLLDQAEEGPVETVMPKFSADWGSTLNDALAAMGMPDAFDSQGADFSRLADGGLCIDQVLHHTFLQVDEKGTKAGAATAVEIMATSMMGPDRMVVLDRPFLYMILDCEHDVPLFIGAEMDVG